MKIRSLLLGALGVLALAGGAEAQGVAVECTPMQPAERVAKRVSPYASTVLDVAGQRAVICYGRPSARGRTMIGGAAVPYGKLWRTGANEPTILHTPVAVEIAGIPVAPGSYSIYTVPGKDVWTVIVNRSTSQWGHESAYTAEIQAQEAGRAEVEAEPLGDHVETFTIRSAPAGKDAVDVILEWEHTRVRVPVRAGK